MSDLVRADFPLLLPRPAPLLLLSLCSLQCEWVCLDVSHLTSRSRGLCLGRLLLRRCFLVLFHRLAHLRRVEDLVRPGFRIERPPALLVPVVEGPLCGDRLPVRLGCQVEGLGEISPLRNRGSFLGSRIPDRRTLE
eukprot:16438223-Heterocapsa_arctica.AAC.1